MEVVAINPHPQNWGEDTDYSSKVIVWLDGEPGAIRYSQYTSLCKKLNYPAQTFLERAMPHLSHGNRAKRSHIHLMGDTFGDCVQRRI
jgi:hypothetical protein